MQDNQALINFLEQYNAAVTNVLYSGALEEEANDCLTLFNDYEWEMKEGSDPVRFNALLKLGNNENMTEAELDEFLGLVSGEGEVHSYFFIWQARALNEKAQAILAEQDPQVSPSKSIGAKKP